MSKYTYQKMEGAYLALGKDKKPICRLSGKSGAWTIPLGREGVGPIKTRDKAVDEFIIAYDNYVLDYDDI